MALSQLVIFLQLALSLLVSAQQPGIPVTLKTQALAIATQAIQTANNILESGAVAEPILTPPSVSSGSPTPAPETPPPPTPPASIHAPQPTPQLPPAFPTARSQSPVSLWENYEVTSEGIVGKIINVDGYTVANPQFDWTGEAFRPCLYSYTLYDRDGIAIRARGGVAFEPREPEQVGDRKHRCFAGALITFDDIPVKYLRVGFFSSANGILNGKLILR